MTYFALDHPYDGFGSPDSRYTVVLETFAVVEGVYTWRGYLPLCVVEAAVEGAYYRCYPPSRKILSFPSSLLTRWCRLLLARILLLFPASMSIIIVSSFTMTR